jgi:hypothetical protein
MRLPLFRPLFTLLLVFFLPGCGSIYPQLGPITSDSLEGCQKFVSQLENQVMDAGEREKWLEWMKKLDLQAREVEIGNLPDEGNPAKRGTDGRFSAP